MIDILSFAIGMAVGGLLVGISLICLLKDKEKKYKKDNDNIYRLFTDID